MSKTITVVVKSQKTNEVSEPAGKTNDIVVKGKYTTYTENKGGGYGYRYDKGNY